MIRFFFPLFVACIVILLNSTPQRLPGDAGGHEIIALIAPAEKPLSPGGRRLSNVRERHCRTARF